MKIYAFYLPQFHAIPENDEWWGEGFTEWTNVRKAQPLYNGHMQPKIPLNNNYYVLNNPNVLRWQAELANSYSIDGMIFYHYYFCGKKLLERPAEILLENEDIPMNFFFCWANHSWIKSWDGTRTVLIDQTYGTKENWEDHFQYLLPFFKDKRYLKIDDKPAFMLFRSDFKEKKEYINFLGKRCIDSGLKGIKIIETTEDLKNSVDQEDELFHLREPASSLNAYRKSRAYFIKRVENKMLKYSCKIRSKEFVEKYDGDAIMKYITGKQIKKSKFIRGLCFEWDNTPRHQYRGYIITPPSKETFMAYMDTIKNDEFLFINAWNEWCEGMILEPTVENGYKYLEWIKESRNG